MRVCYQCEFCGSQFIKAEDCNNHELAHNAVYIDQEEIQHDGIQHSGYCADSAPIYVYLPMKTGVELVRVYGEYIFVRRLTRTQYLQKYNSGEIVDD